MFYIAYSIDHCEDKYIVLCHVGGFPHKLLAERVFYSQEKAEKYVNKELDRFNDSLTRPKKNLIYRYDRDSYEEILNYVDNPEELEHLLKGNIFYRCKKFITNVLHKLNGNILRGAK